MARKAFVGLAVAICAFPLSALAAVQAHSVRDVVEALRRRSVPLSFIEADANVQVVVDTEWPTEKLLAEIPRQSGRYAYAAILGRPVLFAREPRYRLRASANVKDMPRFEAVNKYVLDLSRDVDAFAKFSPWGYAGSFLGGVPAYVPLLQDKVTLAPSAEVIEHFVQLLGSDKNAFFDVGTFMWGGTERRSGISYGIVQGAATQSPADVVARIHGRAMLRREAPRGDILYDSISAQLLQEWAAAQRIKENDFWIRVYKIHQKLWRDFGGGRVVIKKFGPEPFDAYRRFLENEQKKGSFAILDDALRAAFWAQLDEKKQRFASESEAKRLMTTAWWVEAAKESARTP